MTMPPFNANTPIPTDLPRCAPGRLPERRGVQGSNQYRRVALEALLAEQRIEQSFPEAAAQGLTYETAREFVQHGMVIETTTAAYVNHLLHVVEILLPVLGNRNWVVCDNDRAGEHFIVTDNPVAVTWSDTRPTGFFGPAFGKPETDVTIPLSSHVALIGRFEDVPETLELSKQGVAAVNNKTLAYSSRFIAACDDDFLVDTLDRGIVGSKEVIEQIEKWAAEREKKK